MSSEQDQRNKVGSPATTLEALSRTFLDSALDCIITMDATGRVREFNPAAERVFGFTRDEVVGKELASLIIPPRLRERHRQGLAHYLKTGEGPLLGRLIEIAALRRDGTEILVALAISATEIDGSPVFTAYLRDITEQKRVEDTNRRLAAIIESSGDAIISIDLDERITSWNKEAERLFGYGAGEIIGKPITVLIPPDRHNQELEIMERLRRGERIVRYETAHRRKDGTSLEISLAVSPIKDENGHVIGASKIARDITERVRTDRRRSTQYVVSNLLAGSWTLAEVATQILEAIASSGDIRRFVVPNYASGRPRLARACVDFKKTDLGLRRYARFKFSPSSLCGRGRSARWICLSLLLPRRDQQYDGAVQPQRCRAR